MTADFTTRLPPETLNEIIEWADERKALLAMAHVCRRWRHVAFDRPRRFCWPRCGYQNIPDICETADAASLEPAFARLRCRIDHSRVISLRLGALETDTGVAVLKCLADCLPNVSNLYISWDMDTLTQPVFDTLASHPTPILSSLSLTWTTSVSAWIGPQRSSKPRPRVPANILSGKSPALNLLYLTGLELPEAPLPQFAAVTTVSFDPGTPWASDVPWPFQDAFAQHFPALNIMIFPAWPNIRLAPAHTPEGLLLIGRLTGKVTMSEHMLHAALDDYAELATIGSITVYPAYPPDARTLERLLAHFAHDDAALKARYVSAQGAVNVVLSRAGRRRELHVPLDAFGGVFARADGLRLVRATLCCEAFAALRPVLPPDCLRSFTVYIDAGLPPKNPTRPRVFLVLSDFVIARHRYSFLKRDEHITLRAGELIRFVRGALRVSGARTVTLRMEGVSLDRVTPAVQRMFAGVVQERF